MSRRTLSRSCATLVAWTYTKVRRRCTSSKYAVREIPGASQSSCAAGRASFPVSEAASLPAGVGVVATSEGGLNRGERTITWRTSVVVLAAVATAVARKWGESWRFWTVVRTTVRFTSSRVNAMAGMTTGFPISDAGGPEALCEYGKRLGHAGETHSYFQVQHVGQSKGGI